MSTGVAPWVGGLPSERARERPRQLYKTASKKVEPEGRDFLASRRSSATIYKDGEQKSETRRVEIFARRRPKSPNRHWGYIYVDGENKARPEGSRFVRVVAVNAYTFFVYKQPSCLGSRLKFSQKLSNC